MAFDLSLFWGSFFVADNHELPTVALFPKAICANHVLLCELPSWRNWMTKYLSLESGRTCTEGMLFPPFRRESNHFYVLSIRRWLRHRLHQHAIHKLWETRPTVAPWLQSSLTSTMRPSAMNSVVLLLTLSLNLCILSPQASLLISLLTCCRWTSQGYG